ncbi:MAG: bifunctional phosphopantothenoylcysteine decarboxylase/phosphopantothenate--cysteine ligase CoaBC [Candidatus Xenobia bacterium]
MKNWLQDITGSEGSALAAKRVVLALTGSIAIIEAPRLARTLMRQGAEVKVVMSRSATRLIRPDVFEWATGNPVITRLTGRVEHIMLAGESDQRADVIVVAPATANSIGKMALGIDDTPVTTLVSTAIGGQVPLVVAPGMHEPMYRHPAVLENLQRLRSMGAHVVEPLLAEHKAKMAAVAEIVEAAIRAVTPQTLQGRHVLVTAGPTVEYLDPIRVITNRSSGRMGVSLAAEAARRGATGRLIYGPGTVTPSVPTTHVETTAQMREAVHQAIRAQAPDFGIFAAAVGDYAPAVTATEKLPTREGSLTLKLNPTPKILDEIRDLAPQCRIVAFKAETPESDAALIATARQRMQKARADMVVANTAANFGTEKGEVWLVDGQRADRLAPARKADLARAIWDWILTL